MPSVKKHKKAKKRVKKAKKKSYSSSIATDGSSNIPAADCSPRSSTSDSFSSFVAVSTTDPALPPVLCSSIGNYPSREGKGYFYIQVEDKKFQVKQISENRSKKTVLIEERYDKSLAEWINENPETMQYVYKGTEYQNYQPTEEAKMVVRGLLTAFFNLVSSKEEHRGLKCLENYLLTSPIYDHHSTSADEYAEENFSNDSSLLRKYEHAKEKLFKAGEYVRKVKVTIIQDGEHTKSTTTLTNSTSAIIHIIFNKIFKKKNKLDEWLDLRNALKEKKFEYADCHPCLWSWKRRLMLFVDLSSYISNRDEHLRDIAFKAITNTDLFDKDWREKLGDKAPLKRVLNHKHDDDDTSDAAAAGGSGETSNATLKDKSYATDQKRWREGRTLIRFMKNCYTHLTEKHINKLGVREFTNIKINDELRFEDLRFFNHLVTYKLFPMLWIKLFANLHMGHYRFN